MSIVAIKPWSFQVELTKGCQLRCPFCGINSLNLPRDSYEFMAVDTAVRIALGIKALNHKGRVEFAMRGEPLMNPEVVKIVGWFRKLLPEAQLQMTSNGVKLLKDDGHLVSYLFAAGLNILLLDCYRPYGDRLRKQVRSWDVLATLHEFGDGFSPWNNHGPAGRDVVFMPDLRDVAGKTSTKVILNHAGNRPDSALAEPKETICPLPWREPAIHVNGDVPVCCMDWGCEYKMGNAVEDNLRDVWLSPPAVAVRKLLRYGQRWFTPCSRCDGPMPAQNKAIPKCEEPTIEDYRVVKNTVLSSPHWNGLETRFWRILLEDSALL